MNIEYDNDSSDEDYDPNDEKTSDIEEDNIINPLQDINKTRKRHIESIYDELESYENNYITTKLNNSLSKTIKNKNNNMNNKFEKVNTKAIDALSIIFGSKKAKIMLHVNESGVKSNDIKKNKKNKKIKKTSIKDQVKSYIDKNNIQTTTVVTETKKFAGQEIE